ncbi:AIR carboxylase-domain-containing protein [Schizophyllum amplum]|uniref:Phosphoribosylaminoimidazole carboxylase n=1 Tax=Schizophyllum amplum TaxID=97359 RepID=A0A550C076_9AGAR|nr:AIR carboxylase-domain-containing protein [Auriculariopsis ampla]
MLAEAAARLNISLVFLDSGNSPAKQIVTPANERLAHVDGSFADPEKIRELAAKVDVLTVEIEHVDADALEATQATNPAIVIHPAPSTIRLVQDKFRQKEHLRAYGCPLGEYATVVDATAEGVEAAATTLGLPLMLKSRTQAYDGRGNYALRSLDQVPDALKALGGRALYAERWVPFTKEVAVMVVRAADGQVRAYPAVETVHKENVCHLVFAPLRSADPTLASRAQAIAEDAVRTLEGAGVFGVEMFLLEDGTLYINEIAPRPHNSGHYTIEACATSQYENHLRAILGLPLGGTELVVPAAGMLNYIGASDDMGEIRAAAAAALRVPGASVHLYGKAACRRGRKMGHVTIVAGSDAELRERLRPLLLALPGGDGEKDADMYTPIPRAPDAPHPAPLVGVVMGSDSDLPVMLPAARALAQFGVPHEVTIVSAHRTPDRLVEYARSAAARGLRVVIAGAGGAAHLPGMLASMTPLPVIGVPVKGSTLDGVDSLHSIVQMPRGIPVATVAINNGQNAGLLAVRILGVAIPRLVTETEAFARDLERQVLEKAGRLEGEGYEHYVVKK